MKTISSLDQSILAPVAKTFSFIGRCPVAGCTAVFHVEKQGAIETHRTRFGGAFQKSVPVWPGIEVHCVTHKRRIGWRQVDGTFSAEHACDVRCTSARGHKCECSCGGANHGKDWAI
jgi:hypothetical protein